MNCCAAVVSTSTEKPLKLCLHKKIILRRRKPIKTPLQSE
jgi:hypothetical protein